MLLCFSFHKCAFERKFILSFLLIPKQSHIVENFFSKSGFYTHWKVSTPCFQMQTDIEPVTIIYEQMEIRSSVVSHFALLNCLLFMLVTIMLNAEARIAPIAANLKLVR